MRFFRRLLKFSLGCALPVIIFFVVILGVAFFSFILILPELAKDIDQDIIAPTLNWFGYTNTENIYIWIRIIGTFIGTLVVLLSGVAAILDGILGVHILDLTPFWISRKRDINQEPRSYFPFDVITEPANVLPTMLPGPGLIPDHRLPYQRRIKGRNITEELRSVLFKHKTILVSGVGGLGKTREVGKVLSDLIDEGYTILLAHSNAHLDLSIDFPTSLRHRLIIVFDDIHLRCTEISEEEIENSYVTKSFLTALKTFIEKTRAKFTHPEVFVILISRIDVVSWRYLLFPSHSVWENVYHYELQYPDIEGQSNFIERVAEQIKLSITKDDVTSIAQANDGTFRNLVQNIFKAKKDSGNLNLANFTPKQGQTWEDRYNYWLQKYPWELSHLFNTINMLNEIGIPTVSELLLDISASLMTREKYHFLFPIFLAMNRRKLKYILNELRGEGDLVENHETGIISIHEMLVALYSDNRNILLTKELTWKFLKKHMTPNSWLVYAKYLFAKENQPVMAIHILTHTLRKSPDNFDAWITRAYCLFKIDKPSLALSDTEILYKKDPNNSELLNLRGILFVAIGKPELAKANYDRAVIYGQESSYLYANRASFHSMQNDYKSAKQDINKAIEIEPREHNYYLMRSLINWELDKKADAYADLNYAINLDYNFFPAHIQLARYHLLEEQYVDAVKAIDAASAINPESEQVYKLRAELAMKKDDLQAAENYLNEGIELWPNNASLYILRGQIRNMQFKYLRALEDLDKASLRSENATLLTTRSQILIKIGLDSAAQDNIEKALELDPHDIEKIRILAEILRRVGQPRVSLSLLNKAVSRDLNNDELYHERAHIHAILGNTSIALSDFDSAIERNPGESIHHYCKGRHYLHMNRSKDAIRDFAKAIELSPDNPFYHKSYIDAFVQINQLKRVKQTYLRRLEKKKENKMLLAFMAYISVLDKEFTEAEKYLDLLVQDKNIDINPALASIAMIAMLSFNSRKSRLNLKALLRTFRWVRKLSSPESILDAYIVLERKHNIKTFSTFNKLLIWSATNDLNIINRFRVKVRYFKSKLSQSQQIKEKDLVI